MKRIILHTKLFALAKGYSPCIFSKREYEDDDDNGYLDCCCDIACCSYVRKDKKDASFKEVKE